MKIDPKIKKARVDAELGWVFASGVNSLFIEVAATSGEAFMASVKQYMLTSSDPLPDPVDEIEKLAKQSVDLYRTTVRLNSTIVVEEFELAVHGTKPPANFNKTATLAYALGRINGLLGVCWEDAMAPEGARKFLAPHYIKALLTCVKLNAQAWKMMLEYTTQDIH